MNMLKLQIIFFRLCEIHIIVIGGISVRNNVKMAYSGNLSVTDVHSLWFTLLGALCANKSVI